MRLCDCIAFFCKLRAYYAQRYGVHCDLTSNGIVQTATEYVNDIGMNQTYTINGTPLENFYHAFPLLGNCIAIISLYLFAI